MGSFSVDLHILSTLPFVQKIHFSRHLSRVLLYLPAVRGEEGNAGCVCTVLGRSPSPRSPCRSNAFHLTFLQVSRCLQPQVCWEKNGSSQKMEVLSRPAILCHSQFLVNRCSLRKNLMELKWPCPDLFFLSLFSTMLSPTFPAGLSCPVLNMGRAFAASGDPVPDAPRRQGAQPALVSLLLEEAAVWPLFCCNSMQTFSLTFCQCEEKL